MLNKLKLKAKNQKLEMFIQLIIKIILRKHLQYSNHIHKYFTFQSVFKKSFDKKQKKNYIYRIR